jgi:hypothetical protein
MGLWSLATSQCFPYALSCCTSTQKITTLATTSGHVDGQGHCAAALLSSRGYWVSIASCRTADGTMVCSLHLYTHRIVSRVRGHHRLLKASRGQKSKKQYDPWRTEHRWVRTSWMRLECWQHTICGSGKPIETLRYLKTFYPFSTLWLPHGL